MGYTTLYNEIKRKKSFLCIGLDPDPGLLPKSILAMENPLFEFNKAIVDATSDYCVAYKPNFAFYEVAGHEGWRQLEMTVSYIKEKFPRMLIIADAKRGDIGNTAKQYALSVFDRMPCDAVTLAPYMGSDSILPFLERDNKWAVILALTSNSSSNEYEELILDNGKSLYRTVIEKSLERAEALLRAKGESSIDRIMFVVGATKPEKIKEIRSFCPDHFFLIPGVGAQGGTIEDVALNGMNERCGILINASRSIIFADNSANFADYAALAAKEMAQKMSVYV